MRRWEFDEASAGFDARLDLAAQELGLSSKRHILKSLPANVHWHFGKVGAKGTLEATWLPDAQKAWLAVRSNRSGDWIEEAATKLIERLGGSPVPTGGPR
jgi:hypothetical protein